MTNDSTASGATAPRGGGLRTPWRGRPFPVHPLLLAAYPVLFLYGQNLGELEPSDLVGPLVAVSPNGTPPVPRWMRTSG